MSAFPLPPHNLEAERLTLSACLMSPGALVEVAAVLPDPAAFYRDAHALIWAAVLALHEAGEPVDGEAVPDELARRGQWDRCGGLDYWHDVANAAPHAVNAVFSAKIVAEKAKARRLIAECEEIIRAAYAGGSKADALVEDAERRILSVGEAAASPTTVSIHEAAVAAMAGVERRRAGRASGVMTGVGGIDGTLGGLKPKKLYVLAARPSVGKSALALNVADYVSADGVSPVLFVSLEMDREELAGRFLANRAGVPGRRMTFPLDLLPEQTQDLYDAVDHAARESMLAIDDPPHMTIGRLAAVARRHKQRVGLSLLVVDYLQLVDGQPRKGELREQEVARVSRRLKGLAKELDCPVLALCQLNRAVESRDDRKPRMSDLRESGQIEQDADVVMLLHRPEVYRADDEPGVAYLSISKHRGGPCGNVKLHFAKDFQRFTDHPERGHAP